MAVGYNPKIITDGLVLSLDAGNPKSYNAGISTNWIDVFGGNSGVLSGDVKNTDGPYAGAGYVEFDGTGDYLTIATHASDFNFGTGDFTIEFWINSTQTSRADPFAWNFGYTFAGWGSFILNVSSGRIDWYEGLGIATYATSTGWNDGLWHHLAVSRSGTSLKMFLDGVQIGTTASSSYSYGASDVGVSVGFSTSTGYYLNGQMSNVRIVKGTALYTSNFTPPTKPLTDISGTKLLTCQGNTITDASVGIHTITVNGDVIGQKEPFPGAGSVETVTASDFLTVSASGHSDFSMDGDFTVEWWYYRNSVKNSFMWTVGDSQTSTGLELYWGSSGNSLGLYSNGGFIGSISATASDHVGWHHYAVVRSGTTITVYTDGTSRGTATSSTTFSGDLTIGGEYYGGGGKGAPGNAISNFRYIKGTALYTGNFTAPTAPFEPDANTTILTCKGQNIKDYGVNGRTITFNGTAKALTVSGAFEFDGSGDYVEIPDSSDWDFGTGNFTIELFVRADSLSGTRPLLSVRQAGSGGWGIYFASNVVTFYSDSGSVFNYSTSSNSFATTNVWRHVAVTRVGNTFTTYIDGISKGTDTSSNSIDNSANDVLTIGKVWPSGMTYFDGSISGVKIYKGKGLTATEVEQNYNALKGRYA